MIKHFKLSTLYINTGRMLQQTPRETRRRRPKTTRILEVSFSVRAVFEDLNPGSFSDSSTAFLRGVRDFAAQVRPGRFHGVTSANTRPSFCSEASGTSVFSPIRRNKRRTKWVGRKTASKNVKKFSFSPGFSLLFAFLL